MLTNKAKYGLRAMCALTGSAEDWLQAHAIAARANVPPKFLEAILVDLRKAALVRSRRGQTGGHALARAADAIMVGDVIRAIDGPLAPVRCASITAYRPCHDCADPSRCARSCARPARRFRACWTTAAWPRWRNAPARKRGCNRRSATCP